MTDIPQLYQRFLESSGVSTDTRQIRDGQIFFALKGPNFDGNKYASQALESGAAYAVVDDPNLTDDERFIHTHDVLETLQVLARHHRRQWKFPVLALTGSNGKTTTKELIASVMKQRFNTYFTKGNLNNHIGVPLTLLSIPNDCEFAIIEMGANKPGDIHEVCQIAEPDHGLITNIGLAHLEGMGSREGIIKTKTELYRFVDENKGVLFVNSDYPELVEIADQLKNCKKIFYGYNDQCPIHIADIKSDPELIVKLEGELDMKVSSTLTGVYNAQNILSAAVVGHYFELSKEQIQLGISSYIPENHRSQIEHRDNKTLIIDCYNANPTSMEVALQNLAGIGEGKKIAILGDMLELGEFSRASHLQIIQLAKKLKIDEIHLIGPEFAAIRPNTGVFQYQDAESFNESYNWSPDESAIILIKGSRGLALERILPLIQ